MKNTIFLLIITVLLTGGYARAFDQAKDVLLNDEQDIYVAGYELNAQGQSVAKLWKNGNAQDLSNGTNYAQANSVFVFDNDVYVTGWEKSIDAKRIAKLWKNGVAQDLTDGTRHAIAKSVYVSDGDVYVSGLEDNERGTSVVKFWKNGAEQIIFDRGGYNNAIHVSGKDIYVAGSMWGPEVWKNGEPQELSVYSGEAYSVYVSEGKVYVAGFEMRDLHIETAIVWINGEKQILDDNEKHNVATSIYVSDSDIYVAGMEGETTYGIDEYGDTWLNHNTESKEVAKLWVNGLGENLTDGSTNAGAYSVYVSGNDVYVTGYEENEQRVKVVKLWKNGNAQDLSNGSSNAEGFCVFVKHP